ncbi:MAG: acetate--CoA ligase family protein [Firmicutes bacterium]|nr:acetate--CoA ligase family protein [Bacillota bacterium]
MHNNLKKTAGDMRNFFWPRDIAIVGASADPAKPGGKVLQLLKRHGYTGRIYPVNPGRKDIQGISAYASLSQIGTKPDLVIIAVEAARVASVARECAALQITNLVVMSGGFAEIGGRGEALQQELAKVAAENNLTILGPNCIGFINALQPAVASFSLTVESGALRSGPAAFVAQSGGLGILALFLADLEKFGFSYVISTGNELNLDFTTVLDFLVQEPRVKVIGGYLEGVRDGEGFRRSCRAAADAGKPVLILKAGASQEAAAAIRSHTGALAGSREAYRALFRQEGVIEVETLTEMLSLIKVFTPGRLPRGNRAAVFSLSGGMGVLATDLCAAAGLELACFSPETVQALQRLMPSIATVRNPLDPTAALVTKLDEVRETIEIILSDPGVDIFIFTTALWRSLGAAPAKMMAQLFRETDKPFIIIWPGCRREAKKVILESGIPFFRELKDGINAIAVAWRYASFQNARVKTERTAFQFPVTRGQVESLRPKMPAGRGRNLNEAEAKKILSNWGIDIPCGEVVKSYEDAAAAASNIGYPVVLKVVSEQIAHKTELGVIKVDLRDAAMLRQAWEQIDRNLALKVPGIKPAGFLVEEMLPVQLEMIAGAKNDSVFGPLVLLGFGGIHVELFRDIAMRLAPLKPGEVQEMIGELKSAPLLKGFRGEEPVDTASLFTSFSRFSQLAASLRESYREMEINPLVICPGGRAVAADALILL